MLNPTYLTCSRHSIYYFRYPLPASIHPRSKASDIKFSLRTKDSKKALYFSRALAYLGDAVINRAMDINMTYAEIREVLSRHFSDMLQLKRDHIAQNGPLNDFDISCLLGGWELGPGMSDEAENDFLQRFIQRYELPIHIGSRSYAMLRSEFPKAYDAYYSDVKSLNESFQSYNFTIEKAKTLEANPAPPFSEINLDELISHYVEERTRGDNWTSKTKSEYLAIFALLIEIVGEGKLCSNFGLEDARKVKDVLCKLPARYRSNPKTRDLRKRQNNPFFHASSRHVMLSSP